MLRSGQKLAVYMEGCLGDRSGKMGYGVLRYSSNPVACVIDSAHAGRDVQDVIDTPRQCPVVATVSEAADLGGEVLVLGIAPSGGRIPPEWLVDMDTAIDRGMSIINGLHDHLGVRYPDLNDGQYIWDIRKEPENLGIGSAAAAKLNNCRVLMIGTDMAVGKMTAGLEIHKEALARGVKSEFLATGQIGISIMGSGVALDAVRLDYAAGAIESIVMNVKDAELIILEGQGSLLHPGSSATLPLLRGLCPTHMVICHKAGMKTVEHHEWIKIPPLKTFIKMYQDLSDACGAFPRPLPAGVSVNTSALSEDDARKCLAEIEEETSLPTTDVVRFGSARLLDASLDECTT